jgi:hypothetical protein
MAKMLWAGMFGEQSVCQFSLPLRLLESYVSLSSLVEGLLGGLRPMKKAKGVLFLVSAGTLSTLAGWVVRALLPPLAG